MYLLSVWNVLICDRSLVGKLSSDNFSSFSAGPLNHWVPKLPNSFQIYAMLQLVKGWSVQKSGAFATAQNEWSALSFRNRAKSIANGERDGSYCGCCCQSPVVVPEFLGNSPVIRATGIGFAGLAGRFSRCTHKSWVSSRQPEPKGWPRWMGDLVPKVQSSWAASLLKHRHLKKVRGDIITTSSFSCRLLESLCLFRSWHETMWLLFGSGFVNGSSFLQLEDAPV